MRAEVAGHLGTERRGDLRRLRQQEIAGEDGLEVAPLGVDGLHTATGGRFVHDIVVIQRTKVHQFTSDAALNSGIGGRTTGYLRRDHAE